ncbi:MAG: cytochrome c biogenesis protein CcsA [Candidatus Sumerlaeaceae bacterium]
MIPIHELSIVVSVAAMTVAWEAARRHAIRPAKGTENFPWRASGIAVLVTLADLVAEGFARHAFPLETLADALLWFSLTPLVALMAVHGIARNVWPALALLPLAAISQIASLFFRDWFADEAARNALGDVLLAVHVGLFLLGYGAFIVSGGLAVVYLIVDRRLKQRGMADLWSESTPALGRLERLISAAVGLGVVLWSLGLGLGITLFSRKLPNVEDFSRRAFSTDLTVLTSFVVWLYYLTFTILRRRLGWVGRRACLIVLVGIGLILASYTAGKLQSGSRVHGFSATHAAAMEVPR